jgi:hypothetical protein
MCCTITCGFRSVDLSIDLHLARVYFQWKTTKAFIGPNEL